MELAAHCLLVQDLSDSLAFYEAIGCNLIERSREAVNLTLPEVLGEGPLSLTTNPSMATIQGTKKRLVMYLHGCSLNTFTKVLEKRDVYPVGGVVENVNRGFFQIEFEDPDAYRLRVRQEFEEEEEEEEESVEAEAEVKDQPAARPRARSRATEFGPYGSRHVVAEPQQVKAPKGPARGRPQPVDHDLEPEASPSPTRKRARSTASRGGSSPPAWAGEGRPEPVPVLPATPARFAGGAAPATDERAACWEISLNAFVRYGLACSLMVLYFLRMTNPHKAPGSYPAGTMMLLEAALKAGGVCLLGLLAFQESSPRSPMLTSFARLVGVGLIFGSGGDFLLHLAECTEHNGDAKLGDLYFKMGLVSFLVGHVFYIVALANYNLRAAFSAVGLAVGAGLAAFGYKVFQLLLPALATPMVIPVAVYTGVIMAMAWLALANFINPFSAQLSGARPWVADMLAFCAAAGAVIFIASDLALAFNKFQPGLLQELGAGLMPFGTDYDGARKFVMISYYSAQILFDGAAILAGSALMWA